jgi:predicted Zn finger-like uncharacterized protein
MYTFCPNCQTIFRLTTRHLSSAGGYTRCGECRLVYRAVDYLFEDLVSTREAQDQKRQSRVDQAEAEAQEPVFEDQAEAEAQEPVFEEQAAGVEAQAPGVEDQATGSGDEPVPRPLPVHAGDWSRRGLTLRDAFSGVAIIFLAVVLAGQWVFFNRADLARDRNWRPYLVEFCKHMQCSLPQQVDLSQIELVSRDVRQHPKVEEALLVNATLSNKADFTQPYPVLEVSFTDLGGNPVALRRFRPQEYVDDASAIRSGMPPGEPVSIMLEIQDPGESAVSYQFGFL